MEAFTRLDYNNNDIYMICKFHHAFLNRTKCTTTDDSISTQIPCLRIKNSE